jgi:hypothetical protein
MSDSPQRVLAEIAELALKVQALRSEHPEKSTKELIQMAVEGLEKQDARQELDTAVECMKGGER